MARRKRVEPDILHHARVQNEANWYAMCLLLPEDLLKQELKRVFAEGYDLFDEKPLRDICEHFQVSLPTLVLRLMDMKKWSE